MSRDRSTEERVRDVQLWLDAARAVHADRARLAVPIARSTGLSPEGVELGFDCLERDATPAELRALVARAGDAAHVHVILSANVFVAPLRAIAIARAAAPRVTVRPSSRDATLARALVAAAGDPAVAIAEARDPAPDADRIDVYGRDETIAQVRSGARAGVAIRGHGAGLGIAIVTRDADADADADLGAAAEALAADVVPFDQRGCLSPRVVFVAAPPAFAEAFAGELHVRLGAWGARVSRGRLHEDERAESARWRDTLAFAGRVWVGEHDVVALAPPGMPLMAPPSGRHVLVVPVDSVAQVRDRVAPIARFIVTVGTNAPAALDSLALPGARPALLGRMQRPPLDGPVDRRSL
jgi:acyl-CoA reductase LuxC